MKNNSVKFKQSVPRSSNTSVISQFSFESSPMPNAIQFHNFTHAQSISARLSRNSVYNATNIMFNTPRCLVVPQDELVEFSTYSATRRRSSQVAPLPYESELGPSRQRTPHFY